MAEVRPNYFVCTLGEAAQETIDTPFSDVNDLISKKAQDNADLPAIGFFTNSDDADSLHVDTKVLTFDDVARGAANAAKSLSAALKVVSGETVGLLADSSPAFLFAWLGCVRLGHPVLLIAPQCSASAVAHLCRTCNVSVLMTDEKHEKLVVEACGHSNDSPGEKLRSVLMPFAQDVDVFNLVAQEAKDGMSTHTVQSDDIAYLHHTSGTSSGMPKPIPQSHHAAVAVLPALDGRQQATFTNTPLYHAGPADIFRSWTSSAMIWLFPSNHMPVTAKNIGKCLEAAAEVSSRGQTPPIKYFTSVPYILQIMAADEQGLKWLQKMDLVGVGGAALPVEVGNQLVKEDVNVVSRFGAAECGFLLSSHRDYQKDKDWQYLRQSAQSTEMKFEPQEGGLFELVVQSKWPHMSKRNRDDGSYATSDLFEKHASIENAWRYHSRADSQLTLVTGKKFDPAPVEDAIAAASPLISEVLVFGNGQPYPGALLFRSKSAEQMNDADLLENVAPIIERLNKDTQAHARIPRNLLVFMPLSVEPLERSSKGTLQRNKAEQRYAADIEQAYSKVTPHINADVSDKDLPGAVAQLIKSVVGDSGEKLDPEADLFAYGVDSVACVQIRRGLTQLLPRDAPALPLTIVEDSGTVSALSDLVVNLRHGQSATARTDSRLQIPKLVKEHANMDNARAVEDTMDNLSKVTKSTGKTVLMTGPTGSLGSHVLSQLVQSDDIAHIYLLVRGATPQAASERVTKALSSRGLPIPAGFDGKVTIFQSKLSDHDLGIPSQDYSTLQNNIDIVLHLAWSVNFLLSLNSFTPHFAGIRNLLDLCLSSTKPRPPRLVFCSSVASVSEYGKLNSSNDVPEELITKNTACGLTGYASSKLTAELILARAATLAQPLRNRITIVRVGQLSADTQYGVWSKSEAYPQILASTKLTEGSLPDLGKEELLGWLPVDVAAAGFIEASLIEPNTIGDMPTEHVNHEIGKQRKTTETLVDSTQHANATALAAGEEIDKAAVKVLHLLNPNDKNTFTDFISRLQQVLQKAAQSGSQTTPTQTIQLVPAQQWLDKLEQLQQDNHSSATPDKPSHAQTLLRLLPFWKQAYADRKTTETNSTAESSTAQTKSGLSFDMHNSLLAMPSLTQWLGLSTIEGHEARIERSQTAANGDKQANGLKDIDIDVDVDVDVENELLRSSYVLKTWKWVQENVP